MTIHRWHVEPPATRSPVGVLAAILCCAIVGSDVKPLQAGEQAAVEFFERDIRPLLVANCQSCHNAKKFESGLRLTDRESILKGGERGPAVTPGKPDESLLIEAVQYRGELQMPPKGRLSDTDIDKLRRWVAVGSPWPATGLPSQQPPATARWQVTASQRRWWAFQPIQDPPPPEVTNSAWPKNEMDRFILKELEERNLSPATPADRRAWIRRATFDLTGLPPTPAEVEAFLQDDSPAAFSHVVDRLLASPAYGERWARHWLDVVRYADYHDGNPKARDGACEPLNAWRYRDWVVASFNRDLPFHEFIVHQIAGDLLPIPDSQEFYADGLVATTFLSNGTWDRGDADKEKLVSDMVDDNIDTVGKAFLGLTLGCARCHDHKFDPISNEDYYGLAGIFYSTHILKELGGKGGNYTLHRVPLAEKSYVAKRDEELRKLDEVKAKLAELDKKSPKPADDDPQRLMVVAQRDKLQAELLPEPPMAESAAEGGTPGGLFPGIQDVPIHIRGSYTRLGPIVSRHLPRFFAGEARPAIKSGSGRRELAAWVTSKDNPLTARVIVNRIWQWHFGDGWVRTPNNFGVLSEPPTHPALLDWLASRFVEDGWSLKKLHRRIMLSATYQQAGSAPREQSELDPENRWFGRFTPRRLEAEELRDAMLLAAGRLDAAVGGPASEDLASTRRSLYVQTARWDRSNYATLFDAANPDASVEKRAISTVAPQALMLLNHEFPFAQAKHLVERLVREAPSDDVARFHNAYQLLFARPAREEEIEVLWQLLAQAGPDHTEEAWRDIVHVLLCSNEFATLD